MKPSGVILYKGPSRLDGQPIVAIAIGLRDKSRNSKTGSMLQTYILRADVNPVRAIKSGKDFSICGNCTHRGSSQIGRTCYVNIGQGPLAVYRAYRRNKYPGIRQYGCDDISSIGAGRLVRLGTYGDPAAVPAHIWQSLISQAKGHTGYTHQWNASPELKAICMASVDSSAQASAAQSFGWRTFRVAMPNDSKRDSKEAVCPASAEAGKKLTCSTCLACAGAGNGQRGSIVIRAHGGFAVMAAVKAKGST